MGDHVVRWVNAFPDLDLHRESSACVTQEKRRRVVKSHIVSKAPSGTLTHCWRALAQPQWAPPELGMNGTKGFLVKATPPKAKML